MRGQLTISDTTLTGTTGSRPVIEGEFLFLTLERSTISGNTITGGGFRAAGVLRDYEGGAVIRNSTITGNTVTGSSVPLIYFDNFGPGPTIESSTIAGNTGPTPRSQATIDAPFADSASIRNSILVGNTTGSQECFNIASGGHNVVDDQSCGYKPAAPNGDQVAADAGLLPLADNGGPTDTLALKPSSPAVDTGDAAHCQPTDQRGVTRPLDGDRDGSAQCDIGAYELAPPVVTFDPDPAAFGDVKVGADPPATKTITVKNNGTVDLTITAENFTVDGGFTAVIKAGQADCLDAPAVLHPGQTCPVVVKFSPTQSRPYAGRLNIHYQKPGGLDETASDNLTGNGTPAGGPEVSVNPGSLVFGQVRAGERKTLSVRVTNTGQSPLTLSQIQLLGDRYEKLDTTTCTPNVPIAPTDGCDVGIVLAPQEWTEHPGALRIFSDAPGSPYDVGLSGGFVDHTPPQILLRGAAPNEGAHVLLDSSLFAEYACDDGPTGNSGGCTIHGSQDGLDMKDGGDFLATGSLGEKSWQLDATDAAGNRIAVTLHYVVVADSLAEVILGAIKSITATVSVAALSANGLPVTLSASGAQTQIVQANIITTGAGNIISTGAGNIISTGAGNIISTGAGNVISAGGGNIISAGGGNIISAGGGNAVARASSARRPRGKRIVFAEAGQKFTKAGKFKTHVRLTRAGKKALKALSKKVEALRRHHKGAPKYLRFPVNVIVGNIGGKPRSPAYKTTKWVKVKL